MINCPKCADEIDHLNCYASLPVASSLYEDGTETDRQIAPVTDERYDCPDCGETLANNEQDAKDILSGVVTVKLRKMDWPLLRVQKTQLIDVAGLEPEAGEMVEGLLGLLDEIMDQAAEQIGESDVFGESITVYQPEYDEERWQARLMHRLHVYRSRERAEEDYPGLEIKEFDIRDTDNYVFID